mgnify:CR=1 FL=1
MEIRVWRVKVNTGKLSLKFGMSGFKNVLTVHIEGDALHPEVN